MWSVWPEDRARAVEVMQERSFELRAAQRELGSWGNDGFPITRGVQAETGCLLGRMF